MDLRRNIPLLKYLMVEKVNTEFLIVENLFFSNQILILEKQNLRLFFNKFKICKSILYIKD